MISSVKILRHVFKVIIFLDHRRTTYIRNANLQEVTEQRTIERIMMHNNIVVLSIDKLHTCIHIANCAMLKLDAEYRISYNSISSRFT